VTERNDGGRLPAKSAATAAITETTTASYMHAGPSCAARIARGLRQRRDAALRLAPLVCGHGDPDLCLVVPGGPSSFGLSRRELVSEIRRCHAGGWQRWELDATFAAGGLAGEVAQ
jgi:hypothetical protein